MTKTLLFGAGTAARHFIRNDDAERDFIAFMDNDPSKYGTDFNGIRVMAPTEALTLDFDEVVITTQSAEDVQKQLIEELGVSREKVVIPVKQHLKMFSPFQHHKTREFARKVLCDISALASHDNIPLVLDFNTLLDIVRDGDISPSLDTISFSVPMSAMQQLINWLPAAIKKIKHSTNWHIEITKNKSAKPISAVAQWQPEKAGFRPFLVSFSARESQKGISFHLPSAGMWYAPSGHFDTIDAYDWNGIKLAVPSLFESYLEFIYGEWRSKRESLNLIEYNHAGEAKLNEIQEALQSNHQAAIESPYCSHQNEPEDISIVMAVYNHAESLPKALDSALCQEMPYRSKIYCFNDASTDGSGAILQEYAERFPDRIQVFTSPINQGSGKKAFLYHKPKIHGRYWCFLSGDDFWLSAHKLARQIRFLEANQSHVGCSCNTVMHDVISQQDQLIRPSVKDWNLFDLINNKNKHNLYVHTSSVVWRNIYFLKRGFFLPPKYEKDYAFGDVVLFHMMLAEGGVIHNIDRAMSCYRYTHKGIWSSLSTQQKTVMREQVKAAVKRSIPLKYRVLAKLQPLRNISPFLKRALPGALNV